MSLFMPKAPSGHWYAENYSATPTSATGIQVSPGVSNADGAWVQIFAATAYAVAGIKLYFHGMAAHGAINQQVLLDIGIDPAGGSTYVEWVPDILTSQLSTVTNDGKEYFFPIGIPAGSTIAVRARTSHTLTAVFRVAAKIYAANSILPIAKIVEVFGAVPASSTGTGFTPASGSEGAWTLLGTTVNPLWWWTLHSSVSNTVITAERCYVDLAYGDATNKIIMKRSMILGSTNEYHAEIWGSSVNFYDCYFPVPASTNIYVRGRCENAPDTGYVATAIGFGG